MESLGRTVIALAGPALFGFVVLLGMVRSWRQYDIARRDCPRVRHQPCSVVAREAAVGVAASSS